MKINTLWLQIAVLSCVNMLTELWNYRFEDAMAAAQQAAHLNPGHKEIGAVVKRARTVASARSSGNLLFKASKFTEASVVYSQGLEQDPYNSVLLCNRAACRSKLGQYEKAVEDCTAALNLQPCYSKARLRRADCNAKVKFNPLSESFCATFLSHSTCHISHIEQFYDKFNHIEQFYAKFLSVSKPSIPLLLKSHH